MKEDEGVVVDKFVNTLTKKEPLNNCYGNSYTDHVESIPSEKRTESQGDEDRNTKNSDTLMASRNRLNNEPMPHGKESICASDTPTPSNDMEFQGVREHEIAIDLNNEQHTSHIEVEIQVNNNYAPDDLHSPESCDLEAGTDTQPCKLNSDDSPSNVSMPQTTGTVTDRGENQLPQPSGGKRKSSHNTRPKEKTDETKNIERQVSQRDGMRTCLNPSGTGVISPNHESLVGDGERKQDPHQCKLSDTVADSPPVIAGECRCQTVACFKAKIKPTDRVSRNRPKHKPPFHWRPKGKQRNSRSDGNSSTKGTKCNAEKQSNDQHRRQSGQMYSTCHSTQRASSPGGNDNDDDDDDENGDKRQHPGDGNVCGGHSDLNWILLLLLVLMILCFCQLQLDGDTSQPSPHEHTCASQHQPNSGLSLSSETSSVDDGTAALNRGGFLSKQQQRNRSDTDSEGTISSSTFPGGSSAEHLVSEEEGPRFVETRDELAGVKKLRPQCKPREQPHSPCVPPRPQPNLGHEPSQQSYPQLDSAPKVFTSPSPEADCQHVLVLHDPEEARDSRIYVSGCSLYVLNSPEPSSRTCTRTCCFLTEDAVHWVQRLSPQYCNTSGQEVDIEQNCEENGDSPAIFRGPDTPHKNSPKRNEVTDLHTLDSGMGTGSVSNHIPAAQIPVVAGATVDTSWRTSLVNEDLVYLLPSSAKDFQSSFPTILTSVEEQTPRSSDYREELVGVKRFNWRRNSREDHHLTQPVLESSQQDLPVLESALKVFSCPSPDDVCSYKDQDVGDVHVSVFMCICVKVYPWSLFVCLFVFDVYTDSRISPSQWCPLRYFVTEPGTYVSL